MLVLVSILAASLQVARAVAQEPPTEPALSRITGGSLSVTTAGASLTVHFENIKGLVDVLARLIGSAPNQSTEEALAALQERLQAAVVPLQTMRNDAARRATVVETPIRIGDGVSLPWKIQDVPPVYPAASQEAGVQGLVILEVTITPTGDVGDIEVVHSVPELDEAAIAAVEQWRYVPAAVDGVPVPVSMMVTVQFSLPSP